MPHHKRSHAECREALCLLCMKKEKDLRPVTTSIQCSIEKFYVSGYELEDERLPTAICMTCRNILLQHEKDDFSRTIDLFDFSLIGSVPYQTRSQVACQCFICERVRQTICPGGGKSKGMNRRGASAVCKPTVLKLCSSCLSTIQRGKVHVCTKTSRYNNLSQLGGDSNEQIAASVLKTMASQKRDATVQLSVHGGRHPLIVTVSPDSSQGSRTTLSSTDMMNIQGDLHLSDRDTLKLGVHLRSASTCPRSVITPKLKECLYTSNHRLNTYFVTKQMDFIRTEKNVVVEETPRWAVICENVDNFLDYIIQQREYGETEILIRIGIDGGQGFLKICVSVFALDRGLAQAQSYKDSSVQRIFILAIVPNVQENYENLLLLWVSLNLHELKRPYTIATDLKLCNILLGLMSHGACHPCCWCSVDRTSLALQGDDRTLESMRQDFWRWTDNGEGKRQNAKYFNNVVHPAVMNLTDMTTTVLEVIPPPELHLLLGPVNTMYAGLAVLWPGVTVWIEKCHVVREAMHGGSFTGNSCKKLLSNLDLLQSLCPLSCLKYVEAFRAFAKVS